MFPLVSCYLGLIPVKRSGYFVIALTVTANYSEVFCGLRDWWSDGCNCKRLNSMTSIFHFSPMIQSRKKGRTFFFFFFCKSYISI